MGCSSSWIDFQQIAYRFIENVIYWLYMSRSVPWRNKPTPLITQMIPVASEYKLYLVHETGPTSFVFKDDNDNKFKVKNKIMVG